jgi:predicted DNA-binding antitoxin AbrB/MazE fold protein
MKEEIEAVYEKGLLHPLQPLSLSEHEQVAITVHSGDEAWLDDAAHDWANRELEAAPPLKMVRRQLSRISGCLSDTVISERGEY